MSLKSFISAYDFPAVFTRAANVYGPGQQLYRILPRTILFFLTGRTLELHGGGHSVRSFIHIRDVSHGTMKVAENGAVGEAYHLSTPINISIRDLVMKIADQLGVSFEENVVTVGDRLGKDSAYLLDSHKARDSLGWETKISLEQGIEDTIGWVRNNIEILKKQPLDYIHKP
jgi:dTDP-glucose 4,6-dehydratase